MIFQFGRNTYISLFLIFTSFLVLSPTVYGLGSAQKPKINKNPLKIVKAELRADSNLQAQIFLQLDLAQGHYAYVDQFEVSIDEPKTTPQTIEFKKLNISPIISLDDPFSKKLRQVIEGKASIKVTAPQSWVELGKNLKGKLRFQACSKTYCLLPKTIGWRFSFVDQEGLQAQNQTSIWASLTGSGAKSFFEDSLQKSLKWTLLLVFLAGVLTSLTPCIFPMIPITLAVLKGAEGKDSLRSRSFLLSLVYVFGIAITYACLGVLAASTGSLFGSLLGHPAFAIFLFFLFIVLGLSLFGFFEVQVPLRVQNWIAGRKGSGGYKGAFGAGLFAGLLASPCVGPILVAILAHVAKTQDLALGFLLLFVFAIGMGQLFLLIGAFGSLKILPQSGKWMEATKFIFGVIMFGLALFYLQPLVSGQTLALIASVLMLFIAAIGGAFSLKKMKDPQKWWQVWPLHVLTLLALFLAYQSFQKSPTGAKKIHSEVEMLWQEYTPETYQKALASGRPIIIDFYADWCTACKEMELTTFRKIEVVALSREFELLRFDATKSSPEFQKLQGRYEIAGLPWFVFYGPGGNYLEEETLAGYEGEGDFLIRMNRVLSRVGGDPE